ncbi:MAG: hypothetical protein K2O83_13955, partial [Schaedlerella arabinosiphila]|nr:hypothetical protein [Schaedlerella arabinosiphila]
LIGSGFFFAEQGNLVLNQRMIHNKYVFHVLYLCFSIDAFSVDTMDILAKLQCKVNPGSQIHLPASRFGEIMLR